MNYWLSLLLILFSSIPAYSQAVNPCTNGGFESLRPDGSPSDWSPMGDVAVCADAHSGKYALRILRNSEKYGLEAGLNREWLPDNGDQGKMIDRLKGGIEFYYKSILRKGGNLSVMVIPMNQRPFEDTGAGRAIYELPKSHDGDGKWHRVRLCYDYTKHPDTKYVHFAARIVSGTGEFLLDDVSYVEEVGPFLSLEAPRLEEDPVMPGSKGQFTARIRNQGDQVAEQIRLKVECSDQLRVDPAELVIPTLAVDEIQRVSFKVDGPRDHAVRLTLSATDAVMSASVELNLVANLELENFGPTSPVVQEQEPIIWACVLKNNGHVNLVDPVAEVTVKDHVVVVRGDTLRPGERRFLRATTTAEHQTPALPAQLEVRAANTHDSLTAQSSVTVVASNVFPPAANCLKVSTSPAGTLIENQHLRLILRQNTFGAGPLEIVSRTDQGWRTVAWIPVLSRVVYRDLAGKRQEIPVLAKPSEVTATEDQANGTANLNIHWSHEDHDGSTWQAQISFLIHAESPLVDTAYTVTSSQARDLLAFDGPMLYALKRENAIFPGLEWLVKDEVSSSDLDIDRNHADRIRYVVPHYMVTIPAISLQSEYGTLGLLWDNQQKWDQCGEAPKCSPHKKVNAYPSVAFASPDRFNHQLSHLVGLFVPTIPDYLNRNTREAATAYPLKEETPICLQAKILVDGLNRDVLSVIDQWIKCYGIPPAAPLPHGSYVGEIEFSMRAYLESLWEADSKTWWTSKNGHPSMSKKERPRTYLADLLLGSLVTQDPELKATCLARVKEMLELMGGEPRIAALLYPGKPEETWIGADYAGALLSSRNEKGAWSFDADLQSQGVFKGYDYRDLGQDEAVEVGLCALKAYTVLRSALISGDLSIYRKMIKTLELMESFQVPRASQVWEVPVHSPDILASADAADAFLAAYQLSGEKRWLQDAIYWARTGLPFIYLWNPPEHPFLLGATIPVYGASLNLGSWFGVPVQWNGLRLVLSYLKLAEYDQSYPWVELARLMIHSALYQQHPDGKDVALWPDSITAKDGVRCPWLFNPRQILMGINAITGRIDSPQTEILRKKDQTIHITGLAKIQDAQWNQSSPAGSLSFSAVFSPGMEGVVLVANLTKPEEVHLNGTRLAPGKKIETSPNPSWYYNPETACLAIRVPQDGTATIQVEGISHRMVNQIVSPQKELVFTFDQSREGWSPMHDVENLEVAAGVLKGEVTGPDPYIVRSNLNFAGSQYPSVKIRMKVSGGGGAQFYWATQSNPEITEERVMIFPLQADGQFHEYTLDLGKHPFWKGQTIMGIRLDPMNGTSPGSFEIDSITGEK